MDKTLSNEAAASGRQRFIGARGLADRWGVSRSGAVRLAEAAGVESYFLGKGKRGTRRFLLADIEDFERRSKA